jgi:hypothetical protein
VLLLWVGEMMRAANARIEDGPAAFCAATTPNAARPKVINAAMTTTTARIVPSATIYFLLCQWAEFEVKAQSLIESTGTGQVAIKVAKCGFREPRPVPNQR